MKRILRLASIAALLVLLTSCNFNRISRAEQKYLPAQMYGTPDSLLYRNGFVISYNKDTRLPNWVFWHLTKAHANGDVKRPGNAYHEDRKVPKPRATAADYRKGDFSRGHMCPAGDNKWDKNAMYDSFAFTNICPQTERCNSGVWNNIETACREWAIDNDDIYIVCGPIYDGIPDRMGPNEIAIPDAFFKVVICMNGKKKGIGFICDNIDTNQSMKKCVVTIEDVERITGIDFFPNLNARERSLIEEKASLKDW